MFSIRQALNRMLGVRDVSGPAGKYTRVSLDENAIARGKFKKHLGGGAEKWETRGLFQLDLLRAGGLKPSHKFIDIGCGPIRAGEHFIRYLECGNYCGIDYNDAFIKAAEVAVLSDPALSNKAPTLEVVKDFAFSGLHQFDFAICWSVLNHCDQAQKDLFFANVRQVLSPGAKLFISHAAKLTEADFKKGGLVVARRFEISDLELGRYGWPPPKQKSVVPLYELVRS